MPQTAQEQAALLVGISDSYAVAQIASNLPGAEIVGIEQAVRIESFTADLINEGFLPSNLAQGSLSVAQESYTTGSVGGLPQTGNVAMAIGRGLLNMSRGTFQWIASNPKIIGTIGAIGAGTYLAQSYMSQPLQMKALEVESAHQQLQSYLEHADPAAINAALLKTADAYAAAGQSGLKDMARWLLPLAGIGLIGWLFLSSREQGSAY
jgi:hypothetical protein